MTTTKISAGIYRTAAGHMIMQMIDHDGRVIGWNLIGPDGCWWDTYTTKRDALASIS